MLSVVSYFCLVFNSLSFFAVEIMFPRTTERIRCIHERPSVGGPLSPDKLLVFLIYHFAAPANSLLASSVALI